MNIPVTIKRAIGSKTGQLDHIGCSGAQVMLFDDMVLKIQPDSRPACNEHMMLRWLQTKLPVPELIDEAYVEGCRYLLMSRLPGHHLCCDEILDDQDRLAELVADGLRLMWSLDITDCPTHRTLEHKFQEIEDGLRTGKITVESRRFEADGVGVFTSPTQLFDWLLKHRPEEEIVFSHGDYCLPNIFCDSNKLTGLLDLGYAGVADKWVDIEQVVWSMWANTTGQFGGRCRSFDKKRLFDALNMQPDEERMRFYSLLHELC